MSILEAINDEIRLDDGIGEVLLESAFTAAMLFFTLNSSVQTCVKTIAKLNLMKFNFIQSKY